jgi:hypothetical protein
MFTLFFASASRAESLHDQMPRLQHNFWRLVGRFLSLPPVLGISTASLRSFHPYEGAVPLIRLARSAGASI